MLLYVYFILYFYIFLHQPEMTEQELYQLLSGNELTDFDPIKEAFMVCYIQIFVML